jgi:branched-chain amino acid transport system ATP-binding protein
MTTEPLLRVQRLMKRFDGLTALRWVDVEVPQGAIVSLLGPNGAGKTTFVNCVSGVYAPDEGDVLLNGQPIGGQRADRIVRAGIGRTYQTPRLFAEMSLLEHVLVGMHTRMKTGVFGAMLRLPAARREEHQARLKAQSILKYVGLAGMDDVNASSLAVNQQRRLELARALATDPVLLLLDEPVAGLGAQEVAAMIDLIRLLRDQRGMTIVLIEHDLNLVMQLADTVVVLDYGQKIAEGTPAEIRNDPRVITAFLGQSYR